MSDPTPAPTDAAAGPPADAPSEPGTGIPAGTSAATAAPTGTEDPRRPNPRKLRDGIVVSNAMDKTAVVSVVDRVRHARYAKTMQRTKRLYVHDEANDLRVGDRVRVQETRPLSKQKRWRLVEVLERAR